MGNGGVTTIELNGESRLLYGMEIREYPPRAGQSFRHSTIPAVREDAVSEIVCGRNRVVLDGVRMCRMGFVLVLLAVLSVGIVRADPVILCEHGKTELSFPGDPFENRQYTGMTNLGWTKFTLLRPPHDPNLVYFQDSKHFAFHYDFVSECIGLYAGISPQRFDQITLYAEDQQMILGAVLTPPIGFGVSAPIQEYGIQFVRHDPFTREEIAALFHKVVATIAADPNVQPYYFPSYEQSEVARKHAEWFKGQGILVSSAARWARGNTIYSEGWALGRLKYVAPDNIDSAYSRGELLANDILLTDAVPAEIPVLAGVVTLTPSTPNSHVAILARTYAIPFVHLAEEAAREQALKLKGRRIVLRAYASAGFINVDPVTVRLVDANETMTDAQAAAFLTLKQPPELDIQTVESLGRFSASVDTIKPHDIRYFGGKAANYSILRRAIPENSRVAMAFSFDLWNGFLDQTLATGATLREEIARRLSGYTFPPVAIADLAYELERIRDLFKDDKNTHFTPLLEDAVVAALTDPAYGFDPGRKVRFRSSTNVEDSEHFSGAGLYDSYSGCLLDDLDGDHSGPSHCDPKKSKERGVFRAIRRVFSSFYNDNAFLERLRHGIPEDEVGMAILVHHSFPDEIELANGVAVLEADTYRTIIQLVTQEGAVSVANPEPGLIPEEVTVTVPQDSDDVFVRIGRYSNLLPLGQTVMTWKKDYEDLAALLVRAAAQFEQDTGRAPAQLDFEYKKIAPAGELVVKQIRQVPQPANDVSERRFLAGGSIPLSVYQGEHAAILASHRLKSNWQLTADSRWLTVDELNGGLFDDARFEYQNDGRIWTMSGAPASWPKAQHEVVAAGQGQGFEVTDAWSVEHLENPRRYKLVTSIAANGLVPAHSPVLFLSDFTYALEAEYREPVIDWDWEGEITSTTTDRGTLIPTRVPGPDDLLQTRRMEDTGIVIETSFYWPPHPTGPTAGYTAPLIRWVQTTITGLISQPLTLTSDYAQTYEPGHHNFSESFLFEPRLQPGLPQDTLKELETYGVDLIWAVGGGKHSSDAKITTYSLTEDTSTANAAEKN